MYKKGIYEVNKMKIFVSWSGELSKQIAESIKKWIPCFVQAAEIFFSPDDIEKGENWDSKISKELSECKYGIICLTSENVSAPWINFEAGAIAKTLDARVATLMININPSEIKGPLSRYQATKLDEHDFYQLIENINKQCDTPVSTEILKNAFSGLWGGMYKEINDIISNTKSTTNTKSKKESNNEAIEEILQLLRKQNSLLSSPDQLFPPNYFEFINENILKHNHHIDTSELFEEIIRFISWTLNNAENDTEKTMMISELQIEVLIDILIKYCRRIEHRHFMIELRELKMQCRRLSLDDPKRPE